MLYITTLLHRLAADRRGITAVEYAVLAGMVATAIMALGGAFQGHLSNAFNEIFS